MFAFPKLLLTNLLSKPIEIFHIGLNFFKRQLKYYYKCLEDAYYHNFYNVDMETQYLIFISAVIFLLIFCLVILYLRIYYREVYTGIIFFFVYFLFLFKIHANFTIYGLIIFLHFLMPQTLKIINYLTKKC